MVELIWNNWLLVGLLPPFLYAVVALFDACLVDSAVYLNPSEATVVSALFGAIPLLLPLFGFVEFSLPNWNVALVAFAGGVLFALHIFYYISGLFKRNDTVLAETVQNLSVLLVPFFAFFLIGEVLNATHYVGIGLAGAGVLYMYWHTRRSKAASSESMLASGGIELTVSMLLFCLILIAGEWVYQRTDFWSGYLLFTTGLLFVGIVLFVVNPIKRVVPLVRKRWRLFLFIEGITTIGMICSQRAVDISPSATYVAITECLGAYFILLISGIIFFANKWFGTKISILTRVCREQLIGYPAKIIAGLFISTSIFLVYSY
ncbi:MAG: EamA family transporter [Acidiferrobacterales bacterium]|nr:EamA family transporter [Acidiferrobacterales bacterium]